MKSKASTIQPFVINFCSDWKKDTWHLIFDEASCGPMAICPFFSSDPVFIDVNLRRLPHLLFSQISLTATSARFSIAQMIFNPVIMGYHLPSVRPRGSTVLVCVCAYCVYSTFTGWLELILAQLNCLKLALGAPLMEFSRVFFLSLGSYSRSGSSATNRWWKRWALIWPVTPFPLVAYRRWMDRSCEVV